jgi:molecular chaperone Hsp33
MNDSTLTAETFADTLMGFTLPGRNARGRVVRLDQVLDQVLSAHEYPAPITHLLSEALVLGALMGGLLKGDTAQLTIQAQTQGGIVSLLVCDYRGGAVRGYVDFDEDRLGSLGANPSLAALFGDGYLAITFETEGNQRYQGIVPLEGASLADACQSYFSQSEQVPTLIRVASRAGASGRMAAGLLVQHLADGEEGRERLHVRLDHPDGESGAVAGGDRVAAVSRGGGGAGATRRAAVARLPMLSRALQRDHRALLTRRAAGHAQRRWRDRSRLRLLFSHLRPGCLTVGRKISQIVRQRPICAIQVNQSWARIAS